MKFLIDTHVLLWLSGDSENLSERVASLILDEQNSLFLSFASIWEIQIKSQLGKLNLTRSLPNLLEQQSQVNGIQFLEINLAHIYGLRDLPNYHRDPFDRLLIAQSRIEQMPILSIDRAFDAYEVQRIWE
jgi:PIN domain nuclease of toxin-antitoxin system